MKILNKNSKSQTVQNGGTTLRVQRENRRKGTPNYGKNIFTTNGIYRIEFVNLKDKRKHFIDCKTKKAVDNTIKTYRSKKHEMQWKCNVKYIKLK